MKIHRPNLVLKLAIVEKGNQLDACRALNIYPSKLSGIIGGYINPSLELKQKISNYLDKPPEEIFPQEVE